MVCGFSCCIPLLIVIVRCYSPRYSLKKPPFGGCGSHAFEHGEPPAGMMTLYDYLHEKHIAKATQIKIKQAMYKGV